MDWPETLLTQFLRSVDESHAGDEPANMSVRERISWRAGRLSAVRIAQRALRDNYHPAGMTVAAGDPKGEEKHGGWRKQDKRKKKKKKKKKRSRKRNAEGESSDSASSESSGSSSLSSSRERVFREASGVSRNASRSLRAAIEQPDNTLVDSLADLCAVLPASTPGAVSASGGRLMVAQKLPSLFVAYHTIILSRRFTDRAHARSERETRTLCEVLDLLLAGKTMQAIMVTLGRLKAVESSLDADGGGWQVARQMELTARPDQGLVSSRDRALAQRDSRDEQRALHPRQWGTRA